jgi:hypothetical protein
MGRKLRELRKELGGARNIFLMQKRDRTGI